MLHQRKEHRSQTPHASKREKSSNRVTDTSRKPKAYRASGFRTSDRQKVQSILEQILKDDLNINIRTVASTAGVSDEYTAVFTFADNIPRPKCERSYQIRGKSEASTHWLQIDSHFKGLTILQDPATTQAAIDFIALPGLGDGHAYGSFKDPDSMYMWLVDRLPNDLPQLRVIVYGYDTKLPGSNSAQDLENLASQFRTALQTIRSQSATPMIFLAHSLGGLVIKQAIVDMHKSSDPIDRSNFFATYGLYFFGVPNEGMNVELLKSMVRNQPNEEFVISLAKNSQLLRNLARDFSNCFHSDSPIFPFYETRSTPGPRLDLKTGEWSKTGEKSFLVEQSSAARGHPSAYEPHDMLGLDTDHRSLVRFTPSDQNYRSILVHLKRGAQDAPGMIQRRLEQTRQNALKAQKIARQMESSRRIVASNLPSVSPNFIAREAELLAIEDHFRTTRENRPTVVLHGLGGVGKTEIALAYAHSRIDRYQCIFWIDADTEQTVVESFRSICQDITSSEIQAEATNSEVSYQIISQRLGLQGILSEKTGEIKPHIDSKEEKQLVKSVKRWFTDSSHREWLLILDNVDDIESYNVTHFLPPVNGFTIITTRRSEGDFPFCAIAINELSREDATRLVLQITRRIQKDQKVQDAPNGEETRWASKLARLLGDLPLAIELAGAVINRRKISFARYIEIFNESPRPAILNDNPVRWPPRNEDTILMTWQISLTHVHETQPDSERLLRFCGFLDPTNISQEFLRRGLDPLQVAELETGSGILEQMRRIVLDSRDYYEDVVGVLYSYSLAKSRTWSKNLSDKSHSFSLHRLVHVWSRSTLDDDSANDHSAAALVLVDSALKLDNTTASWVLKREAIPHIEVCYRNLPLLQVISSIVFETLDRLAETLRAQDRVLPARDVFKKLIAQREQQGENTMALVEDLHKLGLVYRELAEFDEAKRVTQKAVEKRKELSAPYDPRYFASLNLLASILCEQGDHSTAEETITDIVTRQTATIGRDSADTQKSICGLAIVKWYRDKNAEAIVLTEEHAAWAKKHMEPNHPETLLSQENLAIAYSRNKEHAKALTIYHEVVANRTDIMGATHFQTLSSLLNRGLTFKDMEDFEKATADISTVFETMKNAYEDDGRDYETDGLYQRAQHSWALILEGKGDLKEALLEYEKALQGMSQVFGRDNKMTADVANDMVITYGKLSMVDEANQMMAEYNVRGERD